MVNYRNALMTNYSYSFKAAAIKKKLSRFKEKDFICNFYNHLNSFKDPDVGVISNFPWCCFLAFKWKFSVKENSNAVSMSAGDFIDIINRIYDLQSEASNLSAENNVILGVRRLMVNQFLYQHSDKFNYSSLVRQYIWYCRESSFYEEEFKHITGLNLDAYYRMACYFLVISSINKTSDSELFPLKLFILHWVPVLGAEQVSNFIRLISLKPSGVRGFIKKFAYDNPINIEYYQDTPMLQKPVLLTEDGLVVLSKQILKAGLVNLVPEILKAKSPSYKTKFGATLESYTARILTYHGYSFLTEKQIKEIYKKNNLEGKSADFLINCCEGKVLIDCKAIEPAPYVKTTSDPQKLKERLTSSFIKGIFQCQQTALNLLNAGHISNGEELSIIIVIHRDHYISTGNDVRSLIYPDMEAELMGLYGAIPVELNNIYYITIDAFEHLLGMCNKKGISINCFIKMCAENDSNPRTKMATINLHMANFLPEGVEDTDEIKEVGKLLFENVEEVIQTGSKIWSGKVDEYLSIYRYITR